MPWHICVKSDILNKKILLNHTKYTNNTLLSKSTGKMHFYLSDHHDLGGWGVLLEHVANTELGADGIFMAQPTIHEAVGLNRAVDDTVGNKSALSL